MNNFDDLNNENKENMTEEINGENSTENLFSEDDASFTADSAENPAGIFESELDNSFVPVNLTDADQFPSGISKKEISKGVKVFALLIAAVLLLSASCVTGYLFGINRNFQKSSITKVDLAAKPDLKNQYTAAQVYEKLNESIVGIRVYNDAGQMSDVSGIVYSEKGYIISNDHMYANIPSAKFKVYMYNGSEYDAEYVAGDTVSDLAVLKIKNSPKLKVPEFGNPQEMVCGEAVVAIGRPSDATGNTSITSGVISLLKRRVTTTSSYSASLIQTDSAINPGSSGGALSNMYGQIIGVTSSKLTTDDYEAFGFAIPTTTMKRVVQQLIEHGKVVDRAKLGITYTEINSVTAEIEGYESTGLLVASVSSDSDVAGKISKGDLITHINGQPITNDDAVLDIIEASKAGDKIKITVLNQKGSSKEYDVELKANIGESSYSSAKPNSQELPSSGEFNFPQGE